MDVLTTGQGNLFYHLFVVLVLGLTILLLVPPRQGLPSGSRRRAWVGLIVLLVFQAILLAAGAWGTIGPDAFTRTSLGNLERAVSFASLVVFGWIFLAPQRSRVADTLASVLVILAGVLTILFTYLLAYTVAVAPNLNFNATVLAPTWEILRALTLLPMLVLVGVRRPLSWRPAFAALLVLLLGFLLQLLLGNPNGDLAGYVRLSELIAFPLLAYQVTSRAAREIPPLPEKPLPDQRRVPMEIPSGPAEGAALPGFELQGGEAERAAWASAWIGQSANAQSVLLLALDRGAAELRTVGGYDGQSRSALPPLRQEIAAEQFLPGVFEDGMSARLSDDELPSELHALLERAGLDRPGSVLLIPLATAEPEQAAVLLTRPPSSAPWTAEEQGVVERFASPLSLVLQAPSPPAAPAAAEAAVRTPSVLEAAEVDHLRTRVEELESELRRTAQTRVATGPLPQELPLPTQGAEVTASWASIEVEAARLEEKVFQAISDREERVGKMHGALLAARNLVTAAQTAPQASEAQFSEETAALRLALERAERELAEKRGERAPGLGGNWEESGLPVVDRELVAALIKELHHPMSLAVSYADHLLLDVGRKDGGPSRKTLERVRASLARTSTLLQALEKVALIHEKDLAKEKGPLSVGEVLEGCLGSSRDVVKEKGLLIHMEVAEELASVRLDPGILQQVAEHLIHNAVLATPAHQSVEIRAVSVSVEGSPSPSLLLSVHDGGRGIPSEDYPHVFDRISRTAGLPIEGLGDLGVGLAVANILLQRIGGRLWLESKPDEGTTFQALFPFESG
jgi:signal transduction histidine kinase